MSNDNLQKLMMVYIANARQQLGEDLFANIDIPELQTYLMMAAQCLPMEELMDPVLMRHAMDSLSGDFGPEETLLHVFTLYFYKRLGRTKVHPLELGIMKQQYEGMRPVFEKAVEQGRIPARYWQQYHEMLYNMVEQTDMLQDVLLLLDAEYQRFAVTPPLRED